MQLNAQESALKHCKRSSERRSWNTQEMAHKLEEVTCMNSITTNVFSDLEYHAYNYETTTPFPTLNKNIFDWLI